jgi:hypothetical protein
MGRSPEKRGFYVSIQTSRCILGAKVNALMKNLPFILLFALFGCTSSKPQSTEAPSFDGVRQAAQTQPEAAESDESVRVDALAMAMQSAVLHKQDLTQIKQILKAGFKIDDPIGCGTFNCLDGAVAVHNMQLLNFFLASGAKPKGSALFHAVWCKDPDASFQMVQALLKAGADANYQSQGLSPIGSACFLGRPAVVDLLLSRPGIEFNDMDTDNRTPLMWAAEKGNEKIVALLLAKGANVNVENWKGQTASSLARTEGIRSLIAAAKNPAAIATAAAPPAP